MRKYNFIYIMGRGHSGSTMLDAVLGNSENIESVGELISGLSRFDKIKCSCGAKVPNCLYWQNVVKTYNKDGNFEKFKGRAVKQAHLKRFLKTLFSRKLFKRLLKQNKQFQQSVSAMTEKKIVLDSSKEPTRALMLALKKENLIVHLVKSPVGVVSSTYYRIEKGNEVKFLRKRMKVNGITKLIFLTLISFSWLGGNILAEIVKIRAAPNKLTIRYEDFLQSPRETLGRIGDKSGIDLSGLIARIENGEELKIGHNVGGNSFRFKESFKVDTSRKPRKMPLFYVVLVKLLNWPFMLFYGYSVFGK